MTGEHNNTILLPCLPPTQQEAYRHLLAGFQEIAPSIRIPRLPGEALNKQKTAVPFWNSSFLTGFDQRIVTQSRVISLSACTPHMAIVSRSSPPIFSM